MNKLDILDFKNTRYPTAFYVRITLIVIMELVKYVVCIRNYKYQK